MRKPHRAYLVGEGLVESLFFQKANGKPASCKAMAEVSPMIPELMTETGIAFIEKN